MLLSEDINYIEFNSTDSKRLSTKHDNVEMFIKKNFINLERSN
jgi:hypothetical protein